jgi:hypothetical protein
VTDASIWNRLHDVDREALAGERLQLHHLVQLVASIGLTLVEKQPDDSHTNLGWDEGSRALVSHPTRTGPSLKVGLEFEGLALILLSESETTRFSLVGETLDRAYRWLHSEIEKRIGEALESGLVRPTYELPDHPLRHGAVTDAGSEELRREIANGYRDAQIVLNEFRARRTDASAVRCWPHHFDLATLVMLQAAADPEKIKSVGLGLIPGDASYAEPYWYATPWPYPVSPQPAELEGRGLWHTENWFGAVLPASRWVGGSGSRDQVTAFLASAFDECRRLVE